MRGGAARRGPANPKVLVDQLPLFRPEFTWFPKPQAEWPDFGDSEYLGLDTETYDPNLLKRGPGFIRGDAEVIGVSLADENSRRIYLPIGHVEGNVDRDQAVRYVRHQLRRHDQRKVGANLHYDMEALWSLGIDVNGPLCDIQIAEPLLDEEREGGYSLEALSGSYLGYGKNEGTLRLAARDYRLDPKKHMKYMPGNYAGEYAEDDAENPVQIFMLQEEEMRADDVWKIFEEVEQPLQRVLFKMRMHGVRVDLDAAERLAKSARARENQLSNELVRDAGFAINVNSSPHVARYLSSKGIDVPRNLPTEACPEGSLSVKSEWLLTLTDPAGRLVNDLRKTIKMRKDFVEGMLIRESVRGRLHSQWNQLRKTKDEDGGGGETQGTRSGRIAAANVNLTQVPSRDPAWGKPIRSCFLADEGKVFGKMDYSQQEPRGLLHFAYVMGLDGAAQVRRQYIDDPLTDYHTATQNIILEITGRDIGRRAAKDINLGRAYGMGVDKLARKLGIDVEDAREILRIYDQGVGYVKALDKVTKDRVNACGYITTFLGRKRRFPLWQKRGAFGRGMLPTTRDVAVRLHGEWNIERAGLSKTLNALVQGSAGDQTKRAIVMLDEAGYTPQIQVYDEVNGSYESLRDLEEACKIMERAVDMTVPMDASPDFGRSWGEVSPHVFQRKPHYRERTEREVAAILRNSYGSVQ